MKKVILGKIIDISKGKKHSILKKFNQEATRVIKIDDLRNDKVLKATSDKVGVNVNTKDIIIVWDGANAGTIGYGKSGFIGSTLARLRLKNPKQYDTYFIAKYLQSKFNYLRRTSTGTTIPHINRQSLEKIKIPQLGISHQKRITKVLSDCEQFITWRKESIQLLDNYLEATFFEMFGPKNPNYEKWKVNKIASYALPKKGSMRTGPFGSNLLHKEFQDEGEVKVLGIDNVVNNIFETGKPRYITNEKYQQLKRYSVFGDDVLISIMATNGRSAVVPKNYPTAINSKHLVAITLDQNLILPYYLKYSFQYHPVIKQQLLKNMKGAIMDGLNLTIIKNLKLPQPPLEEQSHFSKLVDKQRSNKKKLLTSLKELEILYAALSQKAFKGKLNLSKVVIDKKVDVKIKKDSTIIEIDKTQYPALKKTTKKRKKNGDIRNMSILDYYGVPEELYTHKAADDYGPELDFIKDDLFYQFYLKDCFANQPFTFQELNKKFNEYYIIKGQVFEPRKWKSILFKFMEGSNPKVEQFFEEETGTIKLKLTNEAFKA